MTYFNTITKEGEETLDTLNPKDFTTKEAYKKEISNKLINYAICGTFVYTSKKKR
jgi:hypothetical protein